MAQVSALVAAIKEWDHGDIYVLHRAFHALDAMLKNGDERGSSSIEDLVDLSSLPSEPFPEGMDTYHVWAMDKAGYVLIGETLDEIVHIYTLWPEGEADE